MSTKLTPEQVYAMVQAIIKMSTTPGVNNLALLHQAKDQISSLVFASLGKEYVIQIWTLLALHILTLIFSLTGIYFRWKSGLFYLFSKEESGVRKPNSGMISQMCFIVYSVMSIICTPIEFLYRVNQQASELPRSTSVFSHTLFVLSFLPFICALHYTAWNMILSPTTSVRLFNRAGNDYFMRGKEKLLARLCFIHLFVIFASMIPWVALLSHQRMVMNSDTRAIFQTLYEIEIGLENGTLHDLTKANDLVPHFLRLLQTPEQVEFRFIGYATTGCFWIFLTLIAYIPTASRLLYTLRTKKMLLEKSVISLRALDDLVSQVPQDSRYQSRPSVHTLDQIKSYQMQSSEPSDPSDPSEKDEKDFYPPSSPSIRFETLASANNNNQSPQLPPKELNQRRAALQLEELDVQMVKTRKLLFTIGMQFVITIIMGCTTVSFTIYLMTVHWTLMMERLVIWLGWSLTLPSFISAALFCWFCCTASPSPPPPPPNASLIESSPVIRSPIILDPTIRDEDERQTTTNTRLSVASREPTSKRSQRTSQTESHTLSMGRRPSEDVIRTYPSRWGKPQPAEEQYVV